ncbi:MAG TPA: FAD:protein FMN transferase [Thermoanaerobaculia bacterium]|nr:FAD:protein FMN transferase [Thermoanaerobaculia bacterium]
MRHSLPLALVALVGPAGTLLAASPALAAPPVLEGRAGGAAVRLEVAGVADAEAAAALADALAAAQEASRLVDSQDGEVARLNRLAGAGRHTTDPQLLALLARADSFCRWSENHYGPLGGWLHELWGVRQPVAARPTPAALQRAVAHASCERLRLDVEEGWVELAPEARLDLWGFGSGFAADRAVAVLQERGIGNATVVVGTVQRAIGPGPGGRGWPLRLPQPAALAALTGGRHLVDRAMAIATAAPGLAIAGERVAPFIDHKSGSPATGVVVAAAVSELAADAQGLATSLFVTRNTLGSQLLGQLRPRPAALWLLGDGSGTPVVTDFRWSAAWLQESDGR